MFILYKFLWKLSVISVCPHQPNVKYYTICFFFNKHFYWYWYFWTNINNDCRINPNDTFIDTNKGLVPTLLFMDDCVRASAARTHRFSINAHAHQLGSTTRAHIQKKLIRARRQAENTFQHCFQHYIYLVTMCCVQRVQLIFLFLAVRCPLQIYTNVRMIFALTQSVCINANQSIESSAQNEQSATHLSVHISVRLCVTWELVVAHEYIRTRDVCVIWCERANQQSWRTPYKRTCAYREYCLPQTMLCSYGRYCSKGDLAVTWCDVLEVITPGPSCCGQVHKRQQLSARIFEHSHAT